MQYVVIAGFIEGLAAWATFFTAVGTLLLAAATFRLAQRTNTMSEEAHRTADAAQQEIEIVTKQAEAAQRQSEISEQALGASIRPLIVDVPPGTVREVAARRFLIQGGYRGGQSEPDTRNRDVSRVFVRLAEPGEDRPEPVLTVDVPFRNVGTGVAIVIDVLLVVPWKDGGSPHHAMGQADHKALPPGETSYARFEFERGGVDWDPAYPAMIEQGDEVAVRVDYTDLGGQQRSHTHLHLRPRGEDSGSYFVYVTKIALVEGNPLGTPFG